LRAAADAPAMLAQSGNRRLQPDLRSRPEVGQTGPCDPARSI